LLSAAAFGARRESVQAAFGIFPWLHVTVTDFDLFFAYLFFRWHTSFPLFGCLLMAFSFSISGYWQWIELTTD